MKRILLILLIWVLSIPALAQANDDGSFTKYRRSSLYSVLIRHSSYPYGNEINQAFMDMPMPDKFNDHNLGIRSFESSAPKMKQKGKVKDSWNMKDMSQFIENEAIARNLIAKWFDWDPENGGFDMELIQERGFYDASQLDIASARQSERGMSTLGDAGESLIGNTFMLVNDITFVDKGEVSRKTAAGISIVGSLAAALLGSSALEDLGNTAAALTNEIDGFTVNITSYLYRLVWNDEIMGTFYFDYWFPKGEDNPSRKSAFDLSRIFKLEYVGSSSTSADILESKSFSKLTKEEQMLKVCARAVDKSIVELQRQYQEFRVNVPVYKISEDLRTVEVQIGLKEGINEKSEFDVLLPKENAEGKITYEKIGRIKPEKGKIWDNRFGALEEAQMIISAKQAGTDVKAADGVDLEAASLNSTTFRILSGAGRIAPGCLVREATIK